MLFVSVPIPIGKPLALPAVPQLGIEIPARCETQEEAASAPTDSLVLPVPSPEALSLFTDLSVRRLLVGQRTGMVHHARGLFRGWGLILPARFSGLGVSGKNWRPRSCSM